MRYVLKLNISFPKINKNVHKSREKLSFGEKIVTRLINSFGFVHKIKFILFDEYFSN